MDAAADGDPRRKHRHGHQRKHRSRRWKTAKQIMVFAVIQVAVALVMFFVWLKYTK